jgi:hypothetical protein
LIRPLYGFWLFTLIGLGLALKPKRCALLTTAFFVMPIRRPMSAVERPESQSARRAATVSWFHAKLTASRPVVLLSSDPAAICPPARFPASHHQAPVAPHAAGVFIYGSVSDFRCQSGQGVRIMPQRPVGG